MKPATTLALVAAVLLPLPGSAQDDEPASGHAHHHVTAPSGGVVMNENRDRLPRDCSGISREYAFTVEAGRTYAADHPGAIFGYSRNEFVVEPCSRLEITFVNQDEVRHQWMVHGLPAYLYPAGMFHLEAPGKTRVSGTFIVPGDDRTDLVHCDMAQPMEKGMRGQLVVGRGSGDLWGVPGVSGDFRRSAYLPGHAMALAVGALALAGLAAWLALRHSPFKDPTDVRNSGQRSDYHLRQSQLGNVKDKEVDRTSQI